MTITVHTEGTCSNKAVFLSMNYYDPNKITTIAGTCVVVCIASDTTINSVNLLTSGAQQIRTKTSPDDSINNSGNVLVTVWIFPNLTASEVTDFCYVDINTGIQAAAATIYTIEGLVTVGPIDKRNAGTGSSTTPSSGASGTTTYADEAVIGIVGTEGPTEDTAGTWGTDVDQNPMRVGTTGQGASSNITVSSAVEVKSSTGSFTASKSGITSRDWAALVVTIKPWAPPPQTLTGAGNISSAQAFGTATVGTIQPNTLNGAGNIPTQEAFGSPLIKQTVLTGAGNFSDTEVFGWPTVRALTIAGAMSMALHLNPNATPPRRVWTPGLIDCRALGTMNMKRDGVLFWFHADDAVAKANYAPSNIADGWGDDSGNGNDLTNYTGNMVQRYDYVESFGGACLNFIHQTTGQGTAFQAVNGTHTVMVNPRYVSIFYFRIVNHDGTVTRYGGTNQHNYFWPLNWRMPTFIYRWGKTFQTGKNYLIVYLQNQGNYYECYDEVWVNGELAERVVKDSRVIAAPSSLSTDFVIGDNTTYAGNHSFYWGEYALWSGVFDRKWINQMQYTIAQKYGVKLEDF